MHFHLRWIVSCSPFEPSAKPGLYNCTATLLRALSRFAKPLYTCGTLGEIVSTNNTALYLKYTSLVWIILHQGGLLCFKNVIKVCYTELVGLLSHHVYIIKSYTVYFTPLPRAVLTALGMKILQTKTTRSCSGTVLCSPEWQIKEYLSSCLKGNFGL